MSPSNVLVLYSFIVDGFIPVVVLVLSVFASIASFYVFYRAVRIVLLVLNGGIDAYRADYQVRQFEARFRRENYYAKRYQRDYARRQKVRQRERDYWQWRSDRIRKQSSGSSFGI